MPKVPRFNQLFSKFDHYIHVAEYCHAESQSPFPPNTHPHTHQVEVFEGEISKVGDLFYPVAGQC